MLAKYTVSEFLSAKGSFSSIDEYTNVVKFLYIDVNYTNLDGK